MQTVGKLTSEIIELFNLEHKQVDDVIRKTKKSIWKSNVIKLVIVMVLLNE